MDTTTTPAGPAAPKQDGRDLQFQNYAETARQEREMLQGSADGDQLEPTGAQARCHQHSPPADDAAGLGVPVF